MPGRGAGLKALVGPVAANGQVLPRKYLVIPDNIHLAVSIIRLIIMRRLFNSGAITTRVSAMARSGARLVKKMPKVRMPIAGQAGSV